MTTYNKQGINLITRYTVEYIDNQQDMDYVLSGSISECEPWEKYKTKQFDNLDNALSLYMVYLVRSDILDIKLFEEIMLDDITIREAYIEPQQTTMYSLKDSINRDMNNTNRKQVEKIEMLENEINHYKQFIGKCNAEKQYKDFIKTA